MQRRIPDLGEKLKTRYSFEQIIGNSKVIKEASAWPEK